MESADANRPTATVLVVDDDTATRVALRAMLAPLGFSIVEAASGEAALRVVDCHAVAAILMDVRMPGMSGYETARLIRDRDGFELTPIIFVTALGPDTVEAATAYASGAVDFIFTPVNGDALRAKVSLFVQMFEQSQQLRRSLKSLTVAHAALHDAEVRTRAVVGSASEGIVTSDPDGLIETFNASAGRMFGYPEADVIGKPLGLILPAAHPGRLHRDGPATGASRSHAARSATLLESTGRRQDGSTFPVEIGTTTTRLGDRTISIDCIRDISNRKEQAALAQRRGEVERRDAQRYRIAFDEAPFGNVITSDTGTIQHVNAAVCAMLGYTSDELVGKSFLEITHPDDRASSRAVVRALKAGAEPQHLEKRYLHRDGSTIEASVAVSAIREDDKEVAQIFAQIKDITVSLRDSRELERSQFEMLARLAAAAELHDDDTGEHTRRVGDLSAAITEQLHWPDPEVRMIRSAAPLHDVGKIATPDAILGKPGKLTAAEFEQIKAHTTTGARMLGGSSHPLLIMAEQIALTHHEKWDGSGYPAGLAGDAIPLAGRIVAVADVFDALTHARPYKPAWSAADALRELTRQAGKHFDPAVVQAFRLATQQ